MTRFLLRFATAFADHLVRRRAWWFGAGLAVTAAALVLLFFRPLSYNRSMESFFPASDPRVQLYKQNKAWFGGEQVLLVAYTDPGLWTPAGMERQLRLARGLKALRNQGVKHVDSLAESPLPKQPLANVAKAIADAPEKADEIKQQIRGTTLYQGVFVANDMQTTALVVQLQPHFDSTEKLAECLEAVRTTAREQLRDAVQRGDVTQPATAGTLLMIHDVYEYTEQDGRLLHLVSVILMGLVIAFSLRSLRWIILPALVVYGALFCSRGVWTVVRGELTMVSSAINALVAVIGVSTVVHFGMYFQELRKEHDPATALRRTFADIGPPIFWVVATTVGGFAALLICELKPVLDFAWFMVIANLLIGVAIMAFLPLGVMGVRPATVRQVSGQDFMSNALMGSLQWVRKRPWLTMLGLTLPAAVIGLGMLWLKPQTDFTGNFRRHTELFQAYDFIETRLGGTGQLDVVFDCTELEKWTDEDWKRLRTLREELGRIEVSLEDGKKAAGVTKVLGLVDFVDFFDATPLAPLPRTMRLRQLNQREPPIVPLFYNREAGKMRLTLQVRERLSSDAKQELIAAAQRKTAETLGPQSRPQTTGIYVMLAHLIDSLLSDQNKTFALSLLCQFVMGVLAFRSLWLALITMLPTVLPVVAVVGTMGWVGLPVNIATAMLASVAMGMTIDSSIMYIYRFQQERRAGADFETALTRTHSTAGIALIISNVALVLGFGVLIISRFIPLVHFGVLTGLALLGGLAGNLILLPLLLHLVPGLKGSARKPSPEKVLTPS